MTARLPAWFEQAIPDSAKMHSVRTILKNRQLHTVCAHAHCPNISSCWAKGVATFMILGNICTRACCFCAVESGRPLDVNPQEPDQLAQAVEALSLRYVVVTSVTRDDLVDAGAGHFARVVRCLKRIRPAVTVEVLIPDFFGQQSLVQQVVEAGADVIAHNMETVKRLSRALRPQANYQRSLKTLRAIKQSGHLVFSKSGLLVGLGESAQEIKELMQDVASTGCDLFTIGQYLAPGMSKRHVPVERFVPPDEFDDLRDMGLKLGLKHVVSAPLVRSSYQAQESYRAVACAAARV